MGKMEAAKRENKKVLERKRAEKKDARKQLETAEHNIITAKAMKIRKEVKRVLPPNRPKWLPFYFWHWLHHAPHFHAMRHKRRIPWTPPQKRDEKRNRQKSSAFAIEDELYDYYGSNENEYISAAHNIGDWNEYDNRLDDEWDDMYNDNEYDDRLFENEVDSARSGEGVSYLDGDNGLSVAVNENAAEFVWMIGLVAVAVFIVFACCASVGARRREKHYDFVPSDYAHYTVNGNRLESLKQQQVGISETGSDSDFGSDCQDLIDSQRE